MKHFILVSTLACALPGHVFAWGPHSEITTAAQDVLQPDDPLPTALGTEAKHLRDYCWMADWRRSLQKEGDRWYYADDYLLFPAMTKHSDHICPEVKQTYEPYFRRALQALRTETPVNAARWIGSIMHFTEDTGSPPHAAEIRGDVHSKMENWVDAKAIHIVGYQPQLLGETDDSAVAGFLKRMDGLIEFSKQRAARAKPFVLGGDRASTEPIVLESALEVSRVVADLLHTLGELAKKAPAEGGTLTGRIVSAASPGMEKLPAKVMLKDTLFSTLADAEGRYEFRHLPPGKYSVVVARAGSSTARTVTEVEAGAIKELDVHLDVDAVAGNLVRDAGLEMLWLSPSQPDQWYPVRPRLVKPQWEGEVLPLTAGGRYHLQVDWQAGAKDKGTISLRLVKKAGKVAEDLKPLEPGEPSVDFTATADDAYAQVVFHGDVLPAIIASHVSVTPRP